MKQSAKHMFGLGNRANYRDAQAQGQVSFKYRSRPSATLDVAALRAIAGAAWRNNRRLNITGYLRYGGDCFEQEMVGEARAVSLLAAAILSDRRHRQIEVLRYCAVEVNRFAGWHFEGFEGLAGAAQLQSLDPVEVLRLAPIPADRKA